MKRNLGCMGLLVAMTALGGCDASSKAPPASDPRGEDTDQAEAAIAPAAPSVAVTLEEAARAFDRGDDVTVIRKDVERILADENAGRDVLDEARLLLSRIREKSGDKEGAITIVEELLASHAEEGRFERRDEAERRLRKLLTGTDDQLPSLDQHGKYAPIAKVLAPYFPRDEAGYTLIDIAVFGSPWNEASDPFVGLRSAMRELREEKCPLCVESFNLARSVTRAESWVDVPRLAGETASDMPNVDRSLVVMLYDLDRNRVPSRYDEYLALPSAEIERRLASGDGLVALRKREGKRPLVVLAAPRSGQLLKVQEAFEKLDALGDEPVSVSLPKRLLAEEIQAVVRAKMPALKRCYEAALERDKEAAGKFDYKFKIKIDGAIEGLEIAAVHSTLDEAFVACSDDVLRHMTFPSAGESTKVTYPMVFSPD